MLQLLGVKCQKDLQQNFGNFSLLQDKACLQNFIKKLVGSFILLFKTDCRSQDLTIIIQIRCSLTR